MSNGGRAVAVPDRWKPLLDLSDVLVLIPDMHMFLHHTNLDNFKFGAEALLNFLMHVRRMKLELARSGHRVEVYQLGDMFELCYPSQRGPAITVEEIIHSHTMYAEIVYQFEELGTKYVAGNHDYSFHRKNHHEHAARNGRVYLEHGFTADGWYSFTNPSHFGWNASMAALRGIRRIELTVNQFRQKLGHLDTHEHSAFGVNSGEIEQSHLPSASAYPKRTLSHFRSALRNMHWYDRPRVCAVAHSHHPMLDTTFFNGECMFIDAGAWTEGRSDFAVITNEEIAVCRYSRQERRQSETRMRAAV